MPLLVLPVPGRRDKIFHVHRILGSASHNSRDRLPPSSFHPRPYHFLLLTNHSPALFSSASILDGRIDTVPEYTRTVILTVVFVPHF